ncbi:MAG: hypothetical protein ABJP45_06375 [Cyclobacteriaceae bacterium]
MKKLKAIALYFSASLLIVSCGSDDSFVVLPDDNGGSETEIVHSGIIGANETWSSSEIHILGDKVVVDDGITLTIEPGTIIKGVEGEGSLASALIVARGGRLVAEGTSSNPIIFTSILDDIEIGQKAGSNLSETENGLWGGLIILGKAPISADASEVQIEGIPADETYGLYGGNSSSDNSGIVRYISVRHGGTLIGEGNEINGITLGGVGNGTIIEYVEVVGNKDDGIEWFGGSVNVSNVLVWAADDDALDVDQAYSGTINNALVLAFSGTDHALEIDGPEGTLEGSFTLSNATLVGVDDEIADFRDGARGTLTNIYVTDFVSPSADLDSNSEADGEGDVELDDDETSANYASGVLNFSAWEINLAVGTTLEDIFADKADFPTSGIEADIQNFASSVTPGTRTVGVDVSIFSNWTFAFEKGKIVDIQ